MPDFMLRPDALVAVIVAATICGVLIVKTRSTWQRLTRFGDLKAVQAAHLTPTPRLGGIAIFTALVAATLVALLVSEAPGSLWLLLLVAALPLFVSGAAEDLGHAVSPAGRLGAALLSAALALWLTGHWIDDTGVPGLDLVLAWAPLAIPVTVIAASTIAHAFNLIDGLNGLAGFTSLFTIAGLGAMAHGAGDAEIVALTLVLGGAILGFLMFNFPFGRIFLGDGGAYFLGFMIAWIGIALPQRHPEVTPLAMLLVMFWPLADLTLAIYRRKRKHLPVSHPDRLHFHQLVMRALEIEVFGGRTRRRIANPIATAIMLPMILAPVIAGSLLYDRPLAAAVALGVFCVLFFATYSLGMRMATRRTRGWSTARRPVAITPAE